MNKKSLELGLDIEGQTYYKLEQGGGAITNLESYSPSDYKKPQSKKIIPIPQENTSNSPTDKNLWRRYKDSNSGRFLFYNEAINTSVWQQDGGFSKSLVKEVEKVKKELSEETSKIREERMTHQKYTDLKDNYSALEQSYNELAEKYNELTDKYSRAQHLALKYKTKYVVKR